MLGTTVSHRRVASKSADQFQHVQVETEPVETDPTGRYLRYPMLLGRGACKCVFRAFDVETGCEVAWNQVLIAGAEMERGTMDRLSEEIRVLQKLYHKNIMTLHHSWYNSRQNSLNFITEMFHSGTLRQYRKKVPHKINECVLQRWAWQILEGLVYLHGHDPPIVHRDLKCDNIFINANIGQIKIGDLGLATCHQGLSVVGTPEFMAPEIYEEQYDHKVDIYSFGMCLLELATQKYPYSECERVAQIFRKVTMGVKPEGLQNVTGGLREVIEKCIAHDPSERPEARELLKHKFFESLRKQQERDANFLKYPFAGSRPKQNSCTEASSSSMSSAPTAQMAASELVAETRSSSTPPAAAAPDIRAMSEQGHMHSHPLDMLESDDGDADESDQTGPPGMAMFDEDDAMSDSSEEIIIPIDCLAQVMAADAAADADDSGDGLSSVPQRSFLGGPSFLPRPPARAADPELDLATSASTPDRLPDRQADHVEGSGGKFLPPAASRMASDPSRRRLSGMRHASALMSQLRISDLFVRTSDPNDKNFGRASMSRAHTLAIAASAATATATAPFLDTVAAELGGQGAAAVDDSAASAGAAPTGAASAPAGAVTATSQELAVAGAHYEAGNDASLARFESFGPVLRDRSRPICGIIIRVKQHRHRDLNRYMSKDRASMETPTGTKRFQSF